MQIKITKDGKSQTIIASLESAKELFPESDGNTHEVVDETPSPRIVKAEKELEGRMWRMMSFLEQTPLSYCQTTLIKIIS